MALQDSFLIPLNIKTKPFEGKKYKFFSEMKSHATCC